MPTLRVTLRNKDFGPIKDGLFMQAQKKAAAAMGVGDGCFVQPRYYHPGDYWGLEDILKAKVLINYVNGSTEYFDNLAAPLNPGTESTLEIELDHDKFQPILSVTVSLYSARYGHSRGGGGGLSNTGKQEIGTASITAMKIRNHEMTLDMALSDLWDETIERDQLECRSNELLELTHVRRVKDLQDTSWKKVELVEDWRSSLASAWRRGTTNKEAVNIIDMSRAIMPIDLIDSGKPGWLLAINDGSCVTEAQQEHRKMFIEYMKNSDTYKSEYESAHARFFSKEDDRTEKKAAPAPEAATEGLTL